MKTQGKLLKNYSPVPGFCAANNKNPFVALLIFFIRIYKLAISPWLPSACRFYPTCSVYAVTALRRHGLLKGFLLSVKRILRCHPFCSGGYDPVP